MTDLTPGMSSGCMFSIPPSYTLSVPSQLNVYPSDQNVSMTVWERISRELAKRRLTWAVLADRLGATKQAAGHWRERGVPAKYFSRIDVFFSKPTGWTEFGTGDAPNEDHPPTERAPAHPYNFHKIQGLEEACNTLARYFEDMPEEDRDNAVRWLSGLVHRPSSAPHVIGALMEMVVTPRKSPPEKSTGT